MTDAQPFPGASGRARALDPVHLEARLATAGWIRSRDGRWRHPESGITVALPGPGEPNLSFIAAATAAMAEGRELEPFIASVERAHMDRYVFAPAAAPDQPQPLPTLVQAAQLTAALGELLQAASRYGASLYGRGAKETMDLSDQILLAPVPGEPAAVELLIPSPLAPEAPRLGPALTAALEQLGRPGRPAPGGRAAHRRPAPLRLRPRQRHRRHRRAGHTQPAAKPPGPEPRTAPARRRLTRSDEPNRQGDEQQDPCQTTPTAPAATPQNSR